LEGSHVHGGVADAESGEQRLHDDWCPRDDQPANDGHFAGVGITSPNGEAATDDANGSEMKPMSMTMPNADDAPPDRLVCDWAKIGVIPDILESIVIFMCSLLPRLLLIGCDAPATVDKFFMAS